MSYLKSILKQKLLPAITFDRVKDALPVAETVLKAGLNVMEIPFRTPVAGDAIKIIREKLPEIYIGAGTLLTSEQVQKALDSGAHFGLSPGLNPSVCRAAIKKKLPFIPGVMTPSEIELAFEMGLNIQKIFPMEQVGGVAFLKAIQGPYGHLDLQFVPMGGVSEDNFKAYLDMPNVIAIGGSWIATKDLIAAKNYKQIEANILKIIHV